MGNAYKIAVNPLGGPHGPRKVASVLIGALDPASDSLNDAGGHKLFKHPHPQSVRSDCIPTGLPRSPQD